MPVWFGGESGPALRRVAEYGDGWISFNLLPDQAAEKIKRIEELLRANGRKRSDVHLAVSPYTNPIKTEDLKRYRDAGVEEIALLSGRPGTDREMVARLEQMAREFVEPAAHSLGGSRVGITPRRVDEARLRTFRSISTCRT